MVDCLTVAAGILARSEEVIKGTGADQRFVKNALKICVLPPIYDKYLFLASFYLIQRKTIQTTMGVYGERYWLMIFVFVNGR